MSQHKDNSGVLFRNAKRKSAASPDYSGNVTIEGVDYWLSAWLKESASQKTRDEKTGEIKPAKFFALAFKRREAK